MIFLEGVPKGDEELFTREPFLEREGSEAGGGATSFQRRRLRSGLAGTKDSPAVARTLPSSSVKSINYKSLRLPS